MKPIEVSWSQRWPGSEVDAVGFLFNAGAHLLPGFGQSDVFGEGEHIPSFFKGRDSPNNILRTLRLQQSDGQLRQRVSLSRPEMAEQIEVGTAQSFDTPGSDMGIVTRHPKSEDGHFQ